MTSEAPLKRTFVFVSDIPAGCLVPVEESGMRGKHPSSKARDPRYERLRRTLADATSGLMDVLHLGENDARFALALYEDEAHATVACRERILSPFPEDAAAPGPLRLRLLKTRNSVAAPEEVFRPTICVEGVEVNKDDLAPTAGLADALRGKCLPKWCTNTAANEDCPLGAACRRLHRRDVQHTTMRKRTRSGEWLAAHGLSLNSARFGTVPALLRSYVSLDTCVPEALRLSALPSSKAQDRVFLDLTVAEVASILDPVDSDAAASLRQRISRCVSNSWRDPSVPLFPKLDAPHSAPWDYALYDAESVVQLRQSCPYPANGMPTPLERDQYNEALLAVLNREFNPVTVASRKGEDGDEGSWNSTAAEKIIAMLRHSPRSAAALRSLISHPPNHSSESSSSSVQVVTKLVLEPFVPIPSVLNEVNVMIRDGNVVSILQRVGQVPYTRKHDGADRQRVYAVALQRASQNLVRHAVAAIGSAEDEGERGSGDGVTFVAQCVVLDAAPSSSSTTSSQSPSVAVLSVGTFLDSIDDNPVFFTFDPSDPKAVIPVFNFSKHFTYPLFPRKILEQLKAH